MKKNILTLAESCEDILAVIVIGSQTRSSLPADRYSDLDVIMVTGHPELYLFADERISRIGDIKISFVEPTVGGGLERRMLLDGSLDVDLVVLSPEQFSGALDSHAADGIFARGCEVMFDRAGLTGRLKAICAEACRRPPVSNEDFLNLTSDFWYHTVWAAKKICRGELWTAKMCVDSYLKDKLLTVTELYHLALHGEEYDVWHNGRMLEQWADDDVVSALSCCFGRYEKYDIIIALLSTAALFGRLAVRTAERSGFDYPAESESYARRQLAELLRN